MNLVGKPVLFRLSVEGYQALGSVLPSGGLFIARVVEQNQLGLWIELQEKETAASTPPQVMLLKWEYFSTAILKSEEPEPRQRIGFR